MAIRQFLRIKLVAVKSISFFGLLTADIDCDSKQPRLNRRSTSKLVPMLIGLKEGLLSNLLCLVGVTKHSPPQMENSFPMVLENVGEGPINFVHVS